MKDAKFFYLADTFAYLTYIYLSLWPDTADCFKYEHDRINSHSNRNENLTMGEA